MGSVGIRASRWLLLLLYPLSERTHLWSLETFMAMVRDKQAKGALR